MVKENRLEDVWFMGGGTNYLDFEIRDKDDEILLLNGSILRWNLYELGQKESPVLSKDNEDSGGITMTDTGVFRVQIDAKDTLSVESNIYEQEITIIQPNGKVLKPVYGYITIRKGGLY